MASKQAFLHNLAKAMSREYALEYFKRKMLEHLEKQLETVEKARGFTAGTIRTWKGKDYIKTPSGAWKPHYKGESRGAKLAVKALMREIYGAQSCRELLQIALKHDNRARFSDGRGHPLPFVKELADYAAKKRSGEMKAAKLAQDALGMGEVSEHERNYKPQKIGGEYIHHGKTAEEAAFAECRRLQKYGRGSGREAVSVMLGNKALGTWAGTENRINIHLATDDAVRAIFRAHGGGELAVIHTHTNDTAFSLEDLTVLLNNVSIGKIAAQGTGKNGKLYTMSIPDGKRVSADKLKEVYEGLEKDMQTQFAAIDAQGKNMRQYNVAFKEILNKKVAEKLGWEFKP